ncbi:MAG: hypothetical protein HY928_15875 [Elusimicrobia bacterium]|nr:hypothetical protein [Elusimicrobiota bacterium]
MSGSMSQELARKAFHFLCLVYLAFYHWQGRGRVLAALGAWVAVVAAVEAVRLSRPGVNAFLLRSFGGIHRKEEEGKVSGIVWTSAGCWLTFACFGARPQTVDGALLMLAFGDAAAALVGKSLGRHVFEFRGKRKSLEGSAACLAACAACALAAGFPPGAALASGLAATAVELAAPWPDDNFWLPLAAAAVLSVSV